PPRTARDIQRVWCRGAHGLRHACRSAQEPRMRASRFATLGRVFTTLGRASSATTLCVVAAAVTMLAQVPPSVSFTRTVYPIFENAQCRGCHTDDGVASATPLHFPEHN